MEKDRGTSLGSGVDGKGLPPGNALGAGPADMTDEQIIDAVAGRVVRMRLAVPAVFFLESTKPLSFLGSQLLIFLQPFVQAFLTIRAYERFAQLMEDRKNVEALIRRVEVLDEEQRAKEKEEKKKRAEQKRRRKAERDGGSS